MRHKFCLIEAMCEADAAGYVLFVQTFVLGKIKLFKDRFDMDCYIEKTKFVRGVPIATIPKYLITIEYAGFLGEHDNIDVDFSDPLAVDILGYRLDCMCAWFLENKIPKKPGYYARFLSNKETLWKRGNDANKIE